VIVTLPSREAEELFVPLPELSEPNELLDVVGVTPPPPPEMDLEVGEATLVIPAGVAPPTVGELGGPSDGGVLLELVPEPGTMTAGTGEGDPSPPGLRLGVLSLEGLTLPPPGNGLGGVGGVSVGWMDGGVGWADGRGWRGGEVGWAGGGVGWAGGGVGWAGGRG